ncbi:MULTISPECIES: hypothetical protein [unclassified Nonomuraea]|uniref:hypothetical protein n=1 Tax=unclassified Nonomuraea TaxID=2593643 RepID=UPI0034077954
MTIARVVALDDQAGILLMTIGIGEVLEVEETRGPGQQEASRTRIPVDLSFDRQQQLWGPLDLVDQQQIIMSTAGARAPARMGELGRLTDADCDLLEQLEGITRQIPKMCSY